jgi:hypothetical protein
VVLEFCGGGGEKQVPFDFALGRLSRQKKGARNDNGSFGVLEFCGGGGEKQVPFGFAQGRLSRQKEGARNDKGSFGVLEFCGGGGEKQVPRARKKALGMTRVLLWFSNSVVVAGRSRFPSASLRAGSRARRKALGMTTVRWYVGRWYVGRMRGEQDFALDWLPFVL